ncbi:retrotransposon protein, putative, ty1-copia subclass [Tanacetum coccineum]
MTTDDKVAACFKCISMAPSANPSPCEINTLKRIIRIFSMNVKREGLRPPIQYVTVTNTVGRTSSIGKSHAILANLTKLRVAFHVINARRLPLASLVYTLVKPPMTTSVVNNSVFRGFFEKQKLTGPNFIDCSCWSASCSEALAAEALAAHAAWVKGSKENAGLMLMTMEPNIQQNLENLSAYEMLQELKTLFTQQRAGTSSNCTRLSLLQAGRRVNYNRHSMGRIINELHAILKLHEQTLPKNNTLALHAIRAVSRNNMVYFSAIPRDEVFKIDLSDSYTNVSSTYALSNKRAKSNLDSALLWHCRLGHISKKRIKKLQHDGLLNSTDLRAFEKCVPCMSRKMARKPYTHQVERAKDLLGLIYTDHKHEVFETFKVFQKEVENGVSERRNRTLLDMVQSMMSQTTLPKSFWDYALETAARILNLVLTKKVKKTPYEVWHGQAPKLSYLKLWGYEALVKRYTITKPDKSTRTRHAPNRMCLYIDAEEHELGDLGEPTNYKATLLDPKSDKWLNAMNVEMQSMKDNKVWDLIDLSSNGKTVGSKWLFKKKTDMDGVVHTYKAHLVAKGYTQTPMID